MSTEYNRMNGFNPREYSHCKETQMRDPMIERSTVADNTSPKGGFMMKRTIMKSEVGAKAALPAWCLSLAFQLWRILDYIVQEHRFDIIEDIGCRPTTYVSIPAILIFYGPIAVFVMLTIIFAGLAFHSFYLRRHTFTEFLHNKKSSFTARLYIRLMVITTVLAIWDAIVIGLVFGLTFRGGMEPYTSWADVHFDFSRLDQNPTASLPQDVLLWQYIRWWTIPLSGLLFFSSFSFGEDAVAEYTPTATASGPGTLLHLRRQAHIFRSFGKRA
ncbi:pheromone A receptor-domain-containing protein [Mycena albidolilacea]|uniref:Pheromone A receptor-domain-containing protein n=1 Tax=Mycena albidolilacea TaxID=1033008 RepID=A0AAD6ZGD4_9AGAR|nr:pheromone A receptor-domain-containing protein [Mycena albidolilacea]